MLGLPAMTAFKTQPEILETKKDRYAVHIIIIFLSSKNKTSYLDLISHALGALVSYKGRASCAGILLTIF